MFFFYCRENNPRQNPSSRTSSYTYSPLSVSPHLSPKGPGYSPSSGYSTGGSALTPFYASPLTPVDNNYFDSYEYGLEPKKGDQQDVHVTKQVRIKKKIIFKNELHVSIKHILKYSKSTGPFLKT